MQATVTVTVKSWDEKRDGEVDDAHAIAQAKFTTEWSGDVTATSTCWLLLSYVAGDPSDPHSLVGPYTGYEQVTGSIGGRSGTFVIAAQGFHGNEVAHTDVTVVPDSGTGELAGLTGSGSYAATGMEYTLNLDYELG